MSTLNWCQFEEKKFENFEVGVDEGKKGKKFVQWNSYTVRKKKRIP